MALEANSDKLVVMAKEEEGLERWRMGLDRNSNFNELNADLHWGDHYIGVVWNKLTIEVGKAKEGLDILYLGRNEE